MDIYKVNEIAAGKLVYNPNVSKQYTSAFASDLMSDVLRYYMENTILITGLCTLQAIRTAEMSGITCIIFGRCKHITQEMLLLAEENGIAVIESGLTLFEISGKLFQNGIRPVTL